MISTASFENLGFYSALLIANDSYNSLTSSVPISIELYNNPCVGVLTAPSNGSFSKQVELSDPPSITPIPIASISNGECNFELELSMKNG